MKLSMNERRCRKIKRRSIYSLKKPSFHSTTTTKASAGKNIDNRQTYFARVTLLQNNEKNNFRNNITKKNMNMFLFR